MKKSILTISLTVIIVISILVLTACGVSYEKSHYPDWENLRGVYGDDYLDNYDFQPNTPDQEQNENDETEPNTPDENLYDSETEPNDNENQSDEAQQPVSNNNDILLMSEVSSLNIRSGPSSSYHIVGSLGKGAMVPLVKTVNNQWHKTIYKGKDAYISANYTQKVEFKRGGEAIERVIDEGKKLLGYPYVWGAQRYHWGPPNANKNYNFVMGEFDCSSLTQYAYYKGAGVVLDLTTRTQVHQGVTVARENLTRGDLMFFTNSSRRHLTGNERVGHVAIYLGDNYILHTASTVAIIEPISNLRWSYYITSKRVL